MAEKMICGCSGSFKCPVAVRLWDAANAAYRAYSDEVIQSGHVGPTAEKLWKVYESARAKYYAHQKEADNG